MDLPSKQEIADKLIAYLLSEEEGYSKKLDDLMQEKEHAFVQRYQKNLDEKFVSERLGVDVQSLERCLTNFVQNQEKVEQSKVKPGFFSKLGGQKESFAPKPSSKAYPAYERALESLNGSQGNVKYSVDHIIDAVWPFYVYPETLEKLKQSVNQYGDFESGLTQNSDVAFLVALPLLDRSNLDNVLQDVKTKLRAQGFSEQADRLEEKSLRSYASAHLSDTGKYTALCYVNNNSEYAHAFRQYFKDQKMAEQNKIFAQYVANVVSKDMELFTQEELMSMYKDAKKIENSEELSRLKIFGTFSFGVNSFNDAFLLRQHAKAMNDRGIEVNVQQHNNDVWVLLNHVTDQKTLDQYKDVMDFNGVASESLYPRHQAFGLNLGSLYALKAGGTSRLLERIEKIIPVTEQGGDPPAHIEPQ